MADLSDDDFLDVPQDATPAYADQVTTAAPRRRLPTAVTTGGWLAVGVVVGVIAVAALHSSTGNTAATGIAGAPAAAANQNPGTGPQQGFAGGPPPGGFGGPGGGPGGRLAGEQHIVGSLTAVGSASITVKNAEGTATYPIEASTVLVKGGQRVSSLSALTVGDTVVVHVYPLNGSTHVELVIDGAPRGGDDNGTGTTTET